MRFSDFMHVNCTISTKCFLCRSLGDPLCSRPLSISECDHHSNVLFKPSFVGPRNWVTIWFRYSTYPVVSRYMDQVYSFVNIYITHSILSPIWKVDFFFQSFTKVVYKNWNIVWQSVVSIWTKMFCTCKFVGNHNVCPTLTEETISPPQNFTCNFLLTIAWRTEGLNYVRPLSIQIVDDYHIHVSIQGSYTLCVTVL